MNDDVVALTGLPEDAAQVEECANEFFDRVNIYPHNNDKYIPTFVPSPALCDFAHGLGGAFAKWVSASTSRSYPTLVSSIAFTKTAY